jgi:dienelactone hydrolase
VIAAVRKISLVVPRPEGAVPAVLWLPAAAASPPPLVLLGHGGGMHKESPFMVRLGQALAGQPGLAALAIDLPHHGERTPPAEVGLSAAARRRRLGLAAWRARNDSATAQAIGDWQAAIDAAAVVADLAVDRLGYYGLSMGTRFGLPLAAAEPRITAAVLGLFGVPAQQANSAFAQAARRLSVPVLYLLQWDDELFPRADGLTLFDLLGSADKTMHAHPGGHLEVPREEIRGAIEFLRGHLGGAVS